MGKNKGGRPPRYKTAEEMQKVIDEYFEECTGRLYTDENGEPKLDRFGNEIYLGAKPPTVTGLALALGFTSRLALLNYQDKDEFVNTVLRAKAKVEEYAESRLFDRDGANGAKFNLSNNFRGWRESQNVEISGKDGGPIQYEAMSAEERQKRIAELLDK